MAFWDRLLRKSSGQPLKREAPPERTADKSSVDDKEVVDRAVDAFMSRETAIAQGTFETAGKGLKNIICADNECPCTDQKQLTPGRDAYLYISPGVVEFRKDCLTVLELEMKVSGRLSPQNML